MQPAPARLAAQRYVEAVNRRDAEALLALFAPQATLHHPTGTYHGHAEIRDFYERLVFAAQVTVAIHRLLAAGRVAMAELTGSSPFSSAATRVVDVFEVGGDGKIAELAIYVR